MTKKPRQEFVDYSAFDYGDDIARWFATEAFKITDTAELIQQTADRLVAGGIPLYRLSYFHRALHPELFGHACFWRRGHKVETALAQRDIVVDEEYLDNPLPLVFEQKRTVRVRLNKDDTISYPILRRLRDEGATDYVALPVVYSDGQVDALSVTADGPNGFSRQDLDRMYALQLMFARIVEIQNLRQTAITLLDTYVGHDAGQQILEGQITRGDSRNIRAVLLYADLRNFTPLSDHLPGEELLQLLNDYFTALEAAIRGQRGEILKFIGDALLAIFRLDAAEQDHAVCAQAIHAAKQAAAGVAEINQQRVGANRTDIDFGMALHIGEVLYGNVGAPGRLDFTVLGPAVNHVVRLESMCRQLHRSPLLSEAFAEILPDAGDYLGAFNLKGIGAPQAIYAAHAGDA